MPPRQIYSTVSLSSLFEEALYTQVRIEADPASADLAPLGVEECTRIKAAVTQEEAFGQAEIRAQARVDYWHGVMQQDIDTLALDMHRLVDGDHSDPRYMLLFRMYPSQVSRMGLDSQMVEVGDWPAFLAMEPSLSSWSGVITSHLVASRGAIEQRDQAATARRNWRARDREEVFATANAFRQDLHSTISLRIRKNARTRTWPDGFFRQATSRKSEVRQTQPTIVP